jgi:ribosome maturation factor RimP
VDPASHVRVLVEPLLADLGLELFDVELKAGILRVSVDREDGIDLDAVTTAAQRISDALDQADPDPVPGRYSLEVSSPGLERPLRTPDHFRRYVGTAVSIKTHPHVEGERRLEGTLETADDLGITIAGRRLAYDDVERARTVFTWGGQPKTKPKKKAAS